MKTRLAILAGAILLIAAAFVVGRQGAEPKTVSRKTVSRPLPVAQAPVREDASRSVVPSRSEVAPLLGTTAAKSDARLGRLESTDPGDRDRAAGVLMSEAVPDLLPSLRERFRTEKNPQDRLRLLHVLIAQDRRFGLPMEIDREALSFLEGLVLDPDREEHHGAAIAALARWESDESFRVLGRVMSNPSELNDFAKAAEWLSECRNPKAATTMLEAFQATDDEDGKMIAANALFKLSAEAPELGLTPILQGQIRPGLEKLLAKADDEWSHTSITKMLEALP